MANREDLFEGLERIEERVSELATAISRPNRSGETNGAAQSRQPRTSFRTVEDEVSRTFGRPGPIEEPVSELVTAISRPNRSGETNGAAQSRQPRTPFRTVEDEVSRTFGRPGPSRDRQAAPVFGLRRNFRGSSRDRSLGRSSSTKKKRVADYGRFDVDIFLLCGPHVKKVPRQGARAWLIENGYSIVGQELRKEWNEVQVLATLKEAFDQEIPDDCDFEILMSCHSQLVKPALAPGQNGLNGKMVHRIFKENKPLYLRPAREIFSDPYNPIVESDTAGLRAESDHYRDGNVLEQMSHQSSNVEVGGGQSPLGLSFEHSTPAPPVNHRTNSQPNGQNLSAPVTGQAPSIRLTTQSSSAAGTPVYQSTLLTSQSSSAPSTTQASSTLLISQTSSASGTSQAFQTQAMDTPLPVDEQSPHFETLELIPKNVTVHRSTLRNDVIEIFKDSEIFKYKLAATITDTRGQPEKGEGRGVFLEVLSQFWQECFTSFMVGRIEKVPFIRHDLQRPEWEAIARVLVYGYRMEKYFPLNLSKLLVAVCLFGDEVINDDFLLKSFRDFVAAEDRQVLDSCFMDSFEADDDVIDFLSSFKCFKVATAENIHSIITELAHQEMVQKPRYVVDCWAPTLHLLRSDPRFQTLEGLEQLYESKQPTARKIIRLFRADPVNDAQRQSFEHLKRFVKSLEGNSLSTFMRFLTGSDVLTENSIQISFTNLDGFERRPVARTCGPLLELPSTYESYPALAEEFTSIMREEMAWSFNIV